MRTDRPLILSVVLLATGLSLIFCFCQGTSGLSAAFPISGSTLHLDVTTTGPAALGGIALTAVGILALLWAFLAAIVGQVSLLAYKPERHEVNVINYKPERHHERVVHEEKVLE